MPRLAPSLFWRARSQISPLAPVLLPACRDLESAANELRWIREHVRDNPSPIPESIRIWQFVEKRGKGVPLQYVLGTQPFGDLDIRCRPGVLIPRPETESYTLHLANLLFRSLSTSSLQQPTNPKPLKILDLCTGTGCIPLLLFSTLLRLLPASSSSSQLPSHIQIHGVDISPAAVRLARENLHRAVAQRRIPSSSSSPVPYEVVFHQGDVFDPSSVLRWSSLLSASPALPQGGQRQPTSQTATEEREEVEEEGIDLLTINPPYISPHGFARTTARSVRNYEPKLALVPPTDLPQISTTATGCVLDHDRILRPHDVFYPLTLEIANLLKSKRVFMEVGSLEQAARVVRFYLRQQQLQRQQRRRRSGEGEQNRNGNGSGSFTTVEIWRDEPSLGDRGERTAVDGTQVLVRGEGRARGVFLSRVD